MDVVCSLFALKFLVIFVTIIPFVTSLTFNFDSFNSSNQNVTYEGDARPGNGAIQLPTPLTDSTRFHVGRATYSKALHLWDKVTGNVTDFSTYFSFSINSQGSTDYGDGLAFFLAPVGSRITENIDGSGSLGLTSTSQLVNTLTNHFVAVEFDTYQNFYDPAGDHVGIDVNSMQSVVNVTWFSHILDGRTSDAWISYNSTSKNLSVVFTGFQLKEGSVVTVLQSLSHKLDLKEYLPEWVTFGFTGAVNCKCSLQRIYSWSFTSSLDDNDNITDPGAAIHNTTNPGAPLPNPKTKNSPRKNRLRLVVGLISGSCLLVAVCVLMFFAFWIRSKGREVNDDVNIDGSMTDEFERSRGPKKFLYSELSRCTNNFAQEQMLGKGGFGGVYKGYLREISSYVAVKRISRESKQGLKEYASEVTITS